MSPHRTDAGRATVARHATLPTPSALSSLLKLLGIAVAVVTVSAIAVVGFVFADVFQQIGDGAVALEDEADVAPPSLGAYPADKAFSILIVGTDECGPVTKELLGKRCSEADGGILNDVNLLVHVSAAPRNVSVISLPRDLGVPVPACTREDGSTASSMRKQSINAVYQHAGLACIVETVSELGDLPIEYAAKISFDGVIDITNAIGGVEVCIGGSGLRDGLAGIDLPPGTHEVSGAEALAFIRSRKGVGDGSDLARISNQQQYMSNLAKKILSSETLTDIPAVLRLTNAVAKNIVPSRSLSDPVRISQFALALNDVPFSDFVFVQYPNVTDPDDADKVIPDEDAAEALWTALKSGRPLQLTGEVATHGGVELVTPATTAPVAPADPSASPPPTGTPAPDARATLPPEISGQTLEQETCSVKP